MTEIHSLQEEFEHLIDQLDSLKSINDLTNRNTEATDALLSGIGNFIQDLHDFQGIITGSYSRLSDSVEGQTDHLKSAVHMLEQKTEDFNTFISGHFEKLYNDYEESVLLKVKNMSEGVIAQAREMSENVSGSNREMAEKVKMYSGQMTEDLSSKTEAISEEVKVRNQEFAQHLGQKTEYLSEKLDSYTAMIEELEGRIALLEKALRNRQDKFEENLTEKMEEWDGRQQERHAISEATKKVLLSHKKGTNIVLGIILFLVVAGFGVVLYLGGML